MSFLGTLNQLGCLKPCTCKRPERFKEGDEIFFAYVHDTMIPVTVVKLLPRGYVVKDAGGNDTNIDESWAHVRCDICHGFGRTIDLAPLLSKPWALSDFASTLVEKAGFKVMFGVAQSVDARNICVVGPQRAHSLLYEVARQLGGSVVTANEDFKWEVVDTFDSGYEDIVQQMNHRGETYRIGRKRSGYRLSVPVPESAKVLFVTDILDVREMKAITAAVGPHEGVLPCVLCLVSRGTHEGVISLYQEDQ